MALAAATVQCMPARWSRARMACLHSVSTTPDDSHPVRQDVLDEVVWTEVIRLLEDPAPIQQELDRRLAPG